MPPKLIFHIGQHKAGSTAIQDAFSTGSVSIEGQRILYTAPLSHNHLPAQFEAWLKADAAAEVPPVLAALEKKLAEGGYDHAVFSAEDFEWSDPEGVARVLERFFLPFFDEMAVICYVRPHAARFLSSYAERVKIGWFQGGMRDFHATVVKDKQFFYAPRLAMWAEVFGTDFHLRPLRRDLLAGGSVVQDFARTAFGPDAPVTIAAERISNEALCLEDLVLLRHVQRQLRKLPRLQRHAAGWALAQALLNRPRAGASTPLALDRAMAVQIRKTYLADARILDRGPFAATPVMEQELDRAVDEAPAEPQSLNPADHFDADELRRVEAMAELAATLIAADPKGARSALTRMRMGYQASPDQTDEDPSDEDPAGD